MPDIKPRILCVDDEPQNLRLLEAMLIPRGYEVVTAKDGKDALYRIARERTDLLLLDVMMPGMTGLEVCRKIKEDKRFRHIPVIMITALNSKDDRIRGIEAGAEDFISKPFEKEEVLARIRMLLRVKDLNDRLISAYADINNMIVAGEDMIKTFDPIRFEFLSRIDRIVDQIIRHESDVVGRPEAVIVGIPERGDRWLWYRYESILGKLQRSSLSVNLENSLDLHKDYPAVEFYNHKDIGESELFTCVRRLESAGVSTTNIACYLSSDLCIFTLNYGREVTDHDASVLNGLVMQGLFLKSLSSQIKDGCLSVHS